MNSIFLERIAKPELLEETLSSILPGQMRPWIILCGVDVAAYVNIIEEECDEIILPAISVDLSGRHRDAEQKSLNVLHRIQRVVGGEICNDA